MFLYKKVQETSNVRYFMMLLTSLGDLVKSGQQCFLPTDQNTHEWFYKVQAVMLFVCLLLQSNSNERVNNVLPQEMMQ